MTVNPGFGGQKYIPYCGEKVRELRKMITEKNLDVDIQVDGGVKAFPISWILTIVLIMIDFAIVIKNRQPLK